MKVIIIDDESAGRKAIRTYITKYTPHLKVVDEADSVKDGLFSILTHQPDLVFLDIRMPDGTGFDLLEKLPEINFKLIFVTAYQEHAVKAFKYSAIDYLLKPLNPDDFMAAVSKINSDNKLDELEKKVALLLKNKNSLENIALPTSTGLKMIAVKSIIRCESDDNYTFFYIDNGEKIIVAKTLKEYEHLLSDEGFYRTHKSHLVNISFIQEYVKGEGGYLILKNGDNILVSRRKKEGLLQCLTQR